MSVHEALTMLATRPPAQVYGQFARHEWGQKMNTLIPRHMHKTLTEYILFGRLSGDFLTAVVTGDLFGCVRSADDENMKHLMNYPKFLINAAPGGSFGSKEQVRNWITTGGLL